jgi:hypothetical protein
METNRTRQNHFFMNLPVCTKMLALGVATILLIISFGCKKDYPVNPATESFPSALNDGGMITIDDARKWFESAQNRNGNEALNLPDQMYPMWYLAKPSKFRGTLDIIIVPIAAKDSMIDIGAYNGAKLIVFKNQNGEIDGNVALFNSMVTTQNLVSTFTGYFTTFSLSGKPLSSVRVANGVLVGGATSLDSIAAYTAAPDCIEYTCPDAIHWFCELFGISHIHCPGTGSSGSGAGAGGNLGGGWFGGSGSGNSGSGGPFGTGTIYVGTGGTVIRIVSSSEGEPVGGGVGTNNTFNNYFENEIFGTETMFNHPTNYPCRNQNLNNPEGEGPVISSLLKAKANGLGNFASQWLALMASGQYGSPAEALDNINWTTVSASNTNDLIDGSLANNALLQAAIAMLNQAETNGCEFTVDQAWEALSEQSSQIDCLLNTAQQIGGMPPAQFNALLRNLDMACTFSTFLGQQNNSSEARDIVTKIIELIIGTNVSTRPDFTTIITSWLGNNSQYLVQHSASDLIDIYNAVANNNIISPDLTGPILELPGALDNCFDNACIGCTHKVTVFVEQPVPGTRELWSIYTHSGGSSGQTPGINAGHSFLSLEQTTPNGEKTIVTLGFYPLDKNHSCTETPGAIREEDDNSLYNLSVGWDVSLENFKKIRDGWNNWQSPSPFSNCNRNCTSAVIYALNQGGLNIPSTSAGYNFPVGTFTVNPGDLGEDLRANPHGGNLNFSTNLSNLSASQLSNCH